MKQFDVRKVIGKTVRRLVVDVVPAERETGRRRTHDVKWIEFTDGSAIMFTVTERQHGHAINAAYDPGAPGR